MKSTLMASMLALGLAGGLQAAAQAADDGGGITPSLSEGTKELVLDGVFDPDTAAGTEMELNVKYGVFVADRVELGGVAGLADNDLATSWRLGIFGEINMETATQLVPYVGGGLSYRYVDFDRGGSTDALELTGEAGVKYFIADNVAISGAGVFSWATDDIYPDDNRLEDTDLKLVLAMRFFFGP